MCIGKGDKGNELGRPHCTLVIWTVLWIIGISKKFKENFVIPGIFVEKTRSGIEISAPNN